jgi:hypothetical protein
MRIPAEKLRQTEAKCNALIAIKEDYGHLIRGLEESYGVRIAEHCVRSVFGGGAGPEQVLLEEDMPERAAERSL